MKLKYDHSYDDIINLDEYPKEAQEFDQETLDIINSLKITLNQ